MLNYYILYQKLFVERIALAWIYVYILRTTQYM
jgi:hypothetical protein